jgi:DNA mismatch endonuclease (patch repair protein)
MSLPVSPRDTGPELALRSALHRRGLRFRVDKSVMRGSTRRADIVLGPSRTIVFVDGCFWHGCPLHRAPPVRNAAYWSDKVARTITRDKDTDARLRALGWRVIHVWEHEDPAVAAEAIRAAVMGRVAYAIVEPVLLFAAVSIGASAGLALNARFPEGVALPLIGRISASMPLAGGALAGTLVARSLGYRRTARVACGLALGAGLVSVAQRPRTTA